MTNIDQPVLVRHSCDSDTVKSVKMYLLIYLLSTYFTKRTWVTQVQCRHLTCGADKVKSKLLGRMNQTIISKSNSEVSGQLGVGKYD